MKKLIALLLAVVMVCSFAACATNPGTESTAPSTGASNGTDGMNGTGIMPDASQPMPGTTEAAPGGGASGHSGNNGSGSSSGGNGAGGSSGGNG